MSKEIVAGRQALRRSFKEYFTKAVDDGRDTRSFLSFRKQKEQPLPPPWMYLFHGDDCLGKSTAVHYCIAIGEEIASELKRETKTVVTDIDERIFTHGSVPSERLELLDCIVDSFCESDGELSGAFSGFRKASEQYRTAMLQIPDHLRSFQLNKILKTPADEDFEAVESYHETLRTILSAQDFELYETGEAKLAQQLVESICRAAEETPLIWALDGYSSMAPDLEQWFRTEVIGKIAPRKNRLILLIGCKGAALRNYRNDFPDEAIFTYNLADAALTRQSIRQLASKLRITLAEDAVSRIERSTAGIPMLVHDILFYAGQGVAVEELTDSDEHVIDEAGKLCATILTRFLRYCTETQLRERVFSLAMLAVSNPKALAEIWNIPFADVKLALDTLEKQTSFIRGHLIHTNIRTLLRQSLIGEAALNTQSSLKPFFVNFSTGNSRLFKESLSQLQTAIPGADKRCSDHRYILAIEQLICGMMWSSPTEAFIYLPGYYLELLHFNLPAAQKLLARIAEFRPVFSPVNEKIFKQLVNGISLADKTLVFNRVAVKPAEDDLISFLESVSESMNDFQRALFHHIRAEVDIRKGGLREAMEHLDNCFSLLGNSAPEKRILYEDYVILGHSFHRDGEHRRAIDTFSNAVLIKPDGFLTWYSMGLSRMALEEYEGAINALSEAVKIDPVHTEAWYSLGLSYIKEELHEEAVGALLRATESSPERAEIWFVLGNSFALLGQHTEAIKAFRKVVLLQPENGEAWILLGNACSSLGTAEEAIEAFQKAINLKPKSVEPLKALGHEYYRLERYDEAVDCFTKASRISKKDDGIWSMIAQSHIGAKQYDKAVDAAGKALALDEKNAATWAIVGNAQMLLENFNEAVEAYTKSVDIEPENAAIWQKLGTIHNVRGEPDDAIAAFKKAVAFDPSLKEVWYTIGKAYESQKQYAEAVSAYEKGVSADPGNSDCWMRKGEMHSVLEQFDDAFECFSKVVKIDPAVIDAWFKRGSSALRAGMYPDAVSSFAKVVELDGSHADGWYNLGLAYQQMGDHQEAVRSFTEAVTHNDKRTDMWYQLGMSCQSLGMFEEAVTAFEKCTELDGRSEEYPTRLGTCYFALNKFSLAFNAYKKAVALAPDNMDTLFQMALAAHSQENFDEAITHYRTITAKKADHADAWFNLALAYHSAGKFDDAIEVYKTCTEKWPENGAAHFNLALAWHAKGDLDSAIVTYREAIKLQPENPDIWYNLAITLHTKELYGDAIQAYRKVLQYRPDHLDAWFNLGTAYYVWQNYTDAVESYSNVVQRDPGHYTAWGNIAIAYYAANEFTKGFDAARKAFAINSEELWIIGNMIVGYLFTGDSLQAQEFADRLFTADREGMAIPQVLQTIETGLKTAPETTGAEAVMRKLKGIPVEVDVAVSAVEK